MSICKRNLISICILSTTAMFLAACNSGGSSTTNNTSYQMVVDAGSSGSRVYVYQVNSGTSLPSITDIFESSNKTGLATFKNNPESAGSVGIQPLLDSAISFMNTTYGIPPQQIRASVMGTAGMRLISEPAQTAIYQYVTNTIVNDGLILGDVGTITGQDEGLYSWADVNYLQNNFNGAQTTNGIVEVGGASAQVAYSTSSVSSSNIVSTTINGQTYNVYAISYLGLGQDQAVASMQALNPSTKGQCYPTGYTSASITGAFNFSGCTSNYAAVTGQYGESLSTMSSQAGFSSNNFIGLSSVYYALDFWGITQTPTQLVPMINGTCNLSWTDMQASYPGNKYLFGQCANATYMNQFLYGSLKLGSSQLTSLNTINDTALTWTLGYLLIYLSN